MWWDGEAVTAAAVGLQSRFPAGHAFAMGVGFQLVCCAERVSFGSGLPVF